MMYTRVLSYLKEKINKILKVSLVITFVDNGILYIES